MLSYHGRDVKLPFLDFKLVSFLNSQPLMAKMNLDEPSEVGPKKLIRLLATRWGLRESAARIKRAMQFGSKIAKLEFSKERGDDTCSRLFPTHDQISHQFIAELVVGIHISAQSACRASVIRRTHPLCTIERVPARLGGRILHAAYSDLRL